MKNYAVVTGASSGIGVEFAKKLSSMGYNLILIARREDRLKKISSKLPTKTKIITADLSDREECIRVYKELEPENIDIFINNAGFGDCGPFISTNLDKDLNMIDVNITAVHIFSKLMLNKMKKQNSGYILNVASCAGIMPAGPYMATYYATKSYVVSLTRAIAEELRENNINIYFGCLCPGPVNTEFNNVANVEFALKGISPKYCAEYAISQMLKKKTVIVPTTALKLGMSLGKFLPTNLYVKIAAHQQKKKIYKKQ